MGQWDLGGETVNHWFDGHAFIHKFEIKNGSGTRDIIVILLVFSYKRLFVDIINEFAI